MKKKRERERERERPWRRVYFCWERWREGVKDLSAWNWGNENT